MRTPGTSANRMIAATSLVSSACVLPSFLLGAMAVQVSDDLGVTASGIGLAFAGFFAAGAVASAPGGRLADRSDPALVARLAATVSAAMSLVLAGFAASLPMIVACLAVAGAANAVCQTAGNLMIVRSLPVRRQGFALAVKQSAIPARPCWRGWLSRQSRSPWAGGGRSAWVRRWPSPQPHGFLAVEPRTHGSASLVPRTAGPRPARMSRCGQWWC